MIQGKLPNTRVEAVVQGTEWLTPQPLREPGVPGTTRPPKLVDSRDITSILTLEWPTNIVIFKCTMVWIRLRSTTKEFIYLLIRRNLHVLLVEILVLCEDIWSAWEAGGSMPVHTQTHMRIHTYTYCHYELLLVRFEELVTETMKNYSSFQELPQE